MAIRDHFKDFPFHYQLYHWQVVITTDISVLCPLFPPAQCSPRKPFNSELKKKTKKTLPTAKVITYVLYCLFKQEKDQEIISKEIFPTPMWKYYGT